jgi:predicted small secreted protein
MIKRLIIVAAILTALFTSMSLTGCGDTWHGFGKDVEDVGEDIQD